MASIEKRGESYRITVSAGYDMRKKQIRRTMTFKPDKALTPRKLKKELERQATLFEEQVKNGQYVNNNIKFEEFAEKWINEYASSQLSPTTLHRYNDCLKRINAAIGHKKLAQLQPLHLNTFYNNLKEDGIRADVKYRLVKDLKPAMQDKSLYQSELARRSGISLSTLRSAMSGNNVMKSTAEKICGVLGVSVKEYFEITEEEKPLSNSTIQYYHHVISSILSTAVQWQIILSNPCDRIKPPKAERKEAEYFDEIEALRLVECLETEPILYRALFTLILHTGMRRGEALGLTWNDVDLERGIVDINKSCLYVPDKGLFEHDTKTKTSHRVIRTPIAAIDVLKEYKLFQSEQQLQLGKKWKGSDKVFTTPEGAPLHPETASAWFRAFAKRNGFENTKIHSLRHTNATLMIANGTDIKTVSRRLGHANVTTTGNIYTHAIQTADERAAEMLNDIFTKK